MKRHVLSFVTAGALALAVTGSLAAPAQAADADTWGYTSTPHNTNGSLDFSGWTSLGVPNIDAQLGSLSFTRNGIDYTIDVKRPNHWSDNSSPDLLVANVISDNTDTGQWTYSYELGNGSTSGGYTDNSSGRNKLVTTSATFYTKSQAGSLAVAVTGTAALADSDEPQLVYSEVLDVTSDGRLVHHLTFTNVSDTTLSNVGFSALLDTMLNDNDAIPIIANGTDSVYIENGEFRLYLDMLQGDQMLVGPWGDGYGSSSLSTFTSPNGYTRGATILDNEDTSVSYGINPVNLAPGKSVSLAFDERLYAPSEVRSVAIKYVDDDADGAAVTPKDGAVTTLTGMPGTNVGFTQTDAEAGMPEHYVLFSIDNVGTYSSDSSASQTITVHLKHHWTPGESMTTTRTIHYTGADDLTPADVVQTQTWTTATDDVTGTLAYASAAGYPKVTSPVIDGYFVDPDAVPATGATDQTTTKPQNTTENVTYIKLLPQNVHVVYVDDDAKGAAVTPIEGSATTLTGMPFENVGFTADTAKASIPAGYVVASIDNVDTYDLDATTDQTITVHLTHHHTMSTLTTTQTVHYTGAGNSTPADNVQTITWKVDTDDVTGVTTYTSTKGYKAVTTPKVSNHVSDVAKVPATKAVKASTTKPTDTTVTVTYSTVKIPAGGTVVSASPFVAISAGILLAGAILLTVAYRRKSSVH